VTLGSYDVAVIGGGIVGLATAMTIARRHPAHRIVVVEKESAVGLHQTGHNSGVIHAGIYYSPGTQKADFCATGGRLLRRFCDEQGIEYKLCGKLIVARYESEVSRLEELYRRGVANGAEGLELVGRERLRELEPHAAGIRAVFSPNTGIVDYGKVAQALSEQVQRDGGDLLTEARVLRISESGGRVHLETSRGDLTAGHIVNCAGLQADLIAQAMGLDTGLRIIPFRGEYFSLRRDRSSLVNGLIYPVPDPELPFLGVHFTRRVDGTVEAGPNAVMAFAREGYKRTDVDAGELLGVLRFPGFWRMAMGHWKTGIKEQYRSLVKRTFLRSLQTLVPEVTMDDLAERGAGVRAQAVTRSGELLQDFSIMRTRNSVHVLNAPSPAATACLAIGEHIADQARESLGLPQATARQDK
jgi:L-2-hydroxyglutarate oxidase LhgO